MKTDDEAAEYIPALIRIRRGRALDLHAIDAIDAIDEEDEDGDETDLIVETESLSMA